MPYLYFPCTMFSTRRTTSGVLPLNVKSVTPWTGAYSQHVAQVIAPNGPFASFDTAQCTFKRLQKAIFQSGNGVSSTHIERLHHLNDRILRVESLWLKQGLEEYIFPIYKTPTTGPKIRSCFQKADEDYAEGRCEANNKLREARTKFMDGAECHY